MSKKGFTLVELLAVLVILSVIMLIAFPSILGAFKSTDSTVSENTKEVLKANARSYVNDKPSLQVSKGCISISDLVDAGYTKSPLASVDEKKSDEIINNWSISYECKDGNCKKFEVLESKCN